MPTSILISIKPQWCELIASGRKTVEVRKTKPKQLTPPFKCYIYESGGRKKVIGEFVCDSIITIDDDAIHACSHEDYCGWNDCELDNACIDPEELEYYANDKWLYGWHISKLVIYEEPRNLSEFWAPKAPRSWCYTRERTTK